MLFDSLDRQAGGEQAVKHPDVAGLRLVVGHGTIVHRGTDSSASFGRVCHIAALVLGLTGRGAGWARAGGRPVRGAPTVAACRLEIRR